MIAPLSLQPVAVEQKSVRWQIFIATEDAHASRQYFEIFRDSPDVNTRIHIEILPSKAAQSNMNTTPIALLERLENKLDVAAKGDVFSIVSDLDSNDPTACKEQIDKYAQQWDAQGILFIAANSNPCFEMWLWLHFFELTDELRSNKLDSTDCLKRSQCLIKKFTERIQTMSPRPYRRTGKRISKPPYTVDKIEAAQNRARALDETKNHNVYWPQNYGSFVYNLVEKINELKGSVK